MAEDQAIPPFWNCHDDLLGGAFPGEVVRQSFPQVVNLDADNAVIRGIVPGPSIKHSDSDLLFRQKVLTVTRRVFRKVSEKCAEPGRFAERLSGQNTRNDGVNLAFHRFNRPFNIGNLLKTRTF